MYAATIHFFLTARICSPIPSSRLVFAKGVASPETESDESSSSSSSGTSDGTSSSGTSDGTFPATLWLSRFGECLGHEPEVESTSPSSPSSMSRSDEHYARGPTLAKRVARLWESFVRPVLEVTSEALAESERGSESEDEVLVRRIWVLSCPPRSKMLVVGEEVADSLDWMYSHFLLAKLPAGPFPWNF